MEDPEPQYKWVESILGPPPERAVEEVEDPAVAVACDWDGIRREREISERRREERLAKRGKKNVLRGGVDREEDVIRRDIKKGEGLRREELTSWERETKPKVKLRAIQGVKKDKRWRHRSLMDFTQSSNEINENLNQRELNLLSDKEAAARGETEFVETSEIAILSRMCQIQLLVLGPECEAIRNRHPSLLTPIEVYLHYVQQKTSQDVASLVKGEASFRVEIAAQEQNHHTKLTLKSFELLEVTYSGVIPDTSCMSVEFAQRRSYEALESDQFYEYKVCIIEPSLVSHHVAITREGGRRQKNTTARDSVRSEEGSHRVVVSAEENHQRDSLRIAWVSACSDTTQALLWRVVRSETEGRFTLEEDEVTGLQDMWGCPSGAAIIVAKTASLQGLSLPEILGDTESGWRRYIAKLHGESYHILQNQFEHHAGWRRILTSEALHRTLTLQEASVEYTRLRILASEMHATVVEHDAETEDDIWARLEAID